MGSTSLAAPIFRKLEDSDYFFNFDEKTFLAYFAGLMFSRVRPLREYINEFVAQKMFDLGQELARDREQFEAACKDLQQEVGNDFNMEALRKFALSDRYKIKQTSAGYNLRIAAETAFKIGSMLAAKSFMLLRSHTDQFFITSDNPICGVKPELGGRASIGCGFGIKGVDVIFPLRRDACFVMNDRDEEGISDSTTDDIKPCNMAVMMLAQQNIYAAKESKNLDQLFQKKGCTGIYGKTALVVPPMKNS